MGLRDRKGPLPSPAFKTIKKEMTDMKGTVLRTAAIGIGGAGCNVVGDARLDRSVMDSVIITSDRNTYDRSDANVKMLIGRDTENMDLEMIRNMLSSYDIVYVVAGMGGVTGTGVTPVVTDIACKMGLTVYPVLISPFGFESGRTVNAKKGIARMRDLCESSVVIENDRTLETMGDLTMSEVFSAVNQTIISYMNRQQDITMKMLRNGLTDSQDMCSAAIPKGIATF